MSGTLEFPSFADARGHLAFLEENRHVPFSVGSVEWWRGTERGTSWSAPTVDQRAIFAIAGSMTIEVVDGSAAHMHGLGRPDRGLLIPGRSRWRVVDRTEDAVGVQLQAVSPRPDEVGAALGREVQLPSVDDARLISLAPGDAVEGAPSGRLVRDARFPLARLYYLFGVPQHMARGSHAHKELEQIIVAVAGSFSLTLNDGITERSVRLDRPDVGLYVPRLMWRELHEFSTDSVCLVLASRAYEDKDYIREYVEFVEYRRTLKAVTG